MHAGGNATGRSVRMAAIYSKNTTAWINVTARGVDENGFNATANGSVLLKSIQPGISLRVMPTEIEACPGDTAEITGLVTNSGDDSLNDVVITQNGSNLAAIGRLEPGEFKVIMLLELQVISNNCTIQFSVEGKDSSGNIWSDDSSLKARTVVTALKVFVSASPPSVMPGARSILPAPWPTRQRSALQHLRHQQKAGATWAISTISLPSTRWRSMQKGGNESWG